MPSATAERAGKVARAPSGARPPAHGVRQASGTWRYLPLAVLVTAATVVLPLAVVELIQRVTGTRSIPLSIAVAIALSAAFASAGAWLWQRSLRSRDILFGDLMLWGFARRVRAERRLSDLGKLLKADPISADGVTSIREQRIEILERLARTLDSRNSYMLGHSQRVARNVQMVAERMGLDAEFVGKLRLAAALHDIGKVNTPTRILNKPEALTDEEYELIKRHAGDGAEMLDPLGDPEIAAMVRHHHERLDGSGYPDGLEGEEIPLGARIIAVADTFDAITSVRPYRPPRKQRAALDVLKEEAGTRLDPDAVAAFRSCYAGRRTAAVSSFVVAVPVRVVGVLTGGAGPAATIAAAGLGGALVSPAIDSTPPAAHVAKSPQHTVVKIAPVEGAAQRSSDSPDRSRRPATGKAKDGGAAGGSEPGAGGGAPIGSAPETGTPGTSAPGTGGGDSSNEGGSADETDLPQTLIDLLPAKPETPAPPEPPNVPVAPELPELPAVPRL